MFILVFRFRLLSHASLVEHVVGTSIQDIQAMTRVELQDSLVITLKIATTNTKIESN
jgi:Zn-dependent membrane protease YugP